MKTKVLEAMAYAKPVLASRQALQGITAFDGKDIITAPWTPHEFCEALLELLSDESRRRMWANRLVASSRRDITRCVRLRAAAVAVHTRHPPQSWKLVGPNGLAQKCQLNGALCPLEPTQHEDEPGSPSRRRSQVSTSSRNRLRAVTSCRHLSRGSAQGAWPPAHSQNRQAAERCLLRSRGPYY